MILPWIHDNEIILGIDVEKEQVKVKNGVVYIPKGSFIDLYNGFDEIPEGIKFADGDYSIYIGNHKMKNNIKSFRDMPNRIRSLDICLPEKVIFPELNMEIDGNLIIHNQPNKNCKINVIKRTPNRVDFTPNNDNYPCYCYDIKLYNDVKNCKNINIHNFRNISFVSNDYLIKELDKIIQGHAKINTRHSWRSPIDEQCVDKIKDFIENTIGLHMPLLCSIDTEKYFICDYWDKWYKVKN
jgi:hypothetical protein